MKNVRPLKEYFFVYFALMFLLALTLGSAFLDLGALNPAVNLGISCLKAALVVVFFMHLKGSVSLTKVFAAAGVLWLAILFTFVATDYVSREWLPLPGHWPQNHSQKGNFDYAKHE
jgi:cytochrome c oxidase subunit 4